MLRREGVLPVRPWAEVLEGDVLRGDDGNAWVVVEVVPQAVTLSHEDRRVAVRPIPGALVEVVARGPLGRAADVLAAAGLGPEVVTQGG